MTDHDERAVPRTTFLGIPVYGSFEEQDARPVQYPIEQFWPILQAVLDDPGCGPLGWQQYRPIFNDGDPCEFGIHAFWATAVDTTVNLARAEPVNPEDDDYYGRHGLDPDFGRRPSRWDADLRKYVDDKYEGPNELRYNRIRALKDAVESGHYLDVLAAAFGTDVRIVIHSAERIDTYHCSHD